MSPISTKVSLKISFILDATEIILLLRDTNSNRAIWSPTAFKSIWFKAWQSQHHLTKKHSLSQKKRSRSQKKKRDDISLNIEAPSPSEADKTGDGGSEGGDGEPVAGTSETTVLEEVSQEVWGDGKRGTVFAIYAQI